MQLGFDRESRIFVFTVLSRIIIANLTVVNDYLNLNVYLLVRGSFKIASSLIALESFNFTIISITTALVWNQMCDKLYYNILTVIELLDS